MSSAVGAALSFDAELLSDVNTAVSEACNNVVVHAYEEGPGPFSVEFAITAQGIDVEVRDHGRGIQPTTRDHDELKVGFALMSALADRAEFSVSPEGGTEVRLAFRRSTLAPSAPAQRPSHHAPRWSGRAGDDRSGEDGSSAGHTAESVLTGHIQLQSALSGTLVLTVTPVPLLAPVLGRLSRALAPAAGFSADGCADVYLVTDALGAHAERAAQDASISVALGAGDQRMEFAVAPLRSGMSGRLARRGSHPARPPLAWLTDEVAVDPAHGYDTLRVAMRDRRRSH